MKLWIVCYNIFTLTYVYSVMHLVLNSAARALLKTKTMAHIMPTLKPFLKPKWVGTKYPSDMFEQHIPFRRNVQSFYETMCSKYGALQ